MQHVEVPVLWPEQQSLRPPDAHLTDIRLMGQSEARPGGRARGIQEALNYAHPARQAEWKPSFLGEPGLRPA